MSELPRHHQRAPVKVAIPIPRVPGERQRYEWLVAEPVGVPADRGSGVYCLYNTAFCSSFGLGDLVDVRRVGQRLEVVALRARGGRTTYHVLLDEQASVEEFLALRAEWAATGSWVEGLCEHEAVVSVEPRDGARPTPQELKALLSTRVLREATIAADPEDRPDDPDLFGHLRQARRT